MLGSLSKTVDVDELAKRWVELVFNNIEDTSDLRLGKDKKLCEDRVKTKRKASQPRK